MQSTQVEKKRGGAALVQILINGAVGLVASLVLLLLCALLISKQVLPSSWLGVAPYLCMGLGSLSCGLGSARCPRRLYGALGGAGVLVFCFAFLGLIFSNYAFSPISLIIVLIISLFSAIIGSVLSTFFK